jgi:predicted kinase
MSASARVLLLTGTCGSGKSTIAGLIAQRVGWVHISEDDVWRAHFHKKRGAFGTDEHRLKRRIVHDIVFEQIRAALQEGSNVVLDAIVHNTPPESYRDYEEFLNEQSIPWQVRVLHPRVDVAVARDRARAGWHAGAEGVTELWAKFTTELFAPDCFLDTSEDSPEETVERVLRT